MRCKITIDDPARFDTFPSTDVVGTFGARLAGGAPGTAIVTTALGALILGTFARLEALFENDWYSDLTLSLDAATAEEEKVTEILGSHGIVIKGMEWKENLLEGERSLIYHLKYRKSEHLVLPSLVVKKLGILPGMRAIHWHG